MSVCRFSTTIAYNVTRITVCVCVLVTVDDSDRPRRWCSQGQSKKPTDVFHFKRNRNISLLFAKGDHNTDDDDDDDDETIVAPNQAMQILANRHAAS